MKAIWNNLSKMDLKDIVEKKNGMSFISWANAWTIIMDHYPASTFKLLPEQKYEDGTVDVHMEVTIEGNTRSMWLPVMDYRNKSIQTPCARQVNDSRMRCLVKCLSLFGLGTYLYRGDSIPSPDQETIETLPLLKKDSPPYKKAVKYYKENKSLTAVQKHYLISDEIKNHIIDEAV